MAHRILRDTDLAEDATQHVGNIAAGTYTYSQPALTQVPFTVTVPAGWTFNSDKMVFKGSNWKLDGVALTTWRITHVYADSCKTESLKELRPASWSSPH